MFCSRAFAALLLIIVGICLACNHSIAPPRPPEEHTETINLSVVTHHNQIEVFQEATQTNQLPSAVVAALGGLADRGQPFNSTDVVDPSLPMNQLIMAAVSEKYCIVSYWQGGMILFMQTSIFELSGGRAKLIWVSGLAGLNFRDLKNTLESGHLHNDLETPKR